MEVVDSLPALERMLGALVGVEWLAVDAEGERHWLQSRQPGLGLETGAARNPTDAMQA